MAKLCQVILSAAGGKDVTVEEFMPKFGRAYDAPETPAALDAKIRGAFARLAATARSNDSSE